MPQKKNKRKNRYKRKEDDIPNSHICVVCDDWCRPVDNMDEDIGYACEDCPNVYHDRCIGKAFRNRKFDTCGDLGHECDNESPPLYFALGPQIDHIAQRKKKKIKGKSTRLSKTSKKKRISKIGGIHKKTYKSFKYMETEYELGDDVVIELETEGEQVARIREIYAYDDDKMPKMDIIWFWTADEALRDMEGSNDQENSNNVNQDDIITSNELHIDDTYRQNDINVKCLVETEKSSKALVLSSSSLYLKAIDKKENNDKYYGIYWCSHAYNGITKKKSLLSSDAISSHRIAGITPAKDRKSRKRDRKSIICNALSDASKSLMLSSVPLRLPCREKEHDEILQYMKLQISSQGQGSGLYISGMPGTGKTATVRQIANELKQLTAGNGKNGKRRGRRNKNKLPNFEFHEINAMKLPTPHHIYTELAKKLMGKHFSPNTAVKKLEKYFSTADVNRVICVLLVDELDYLLTRQQKVIYNIFDWPTKTNGKLVVIGIANTMDLPERLLPRVSSRMGTARVVFKAYQRHQLTRIIEDRLDSTKVFSKDAIRFCASAVAGVSGDCRTALQICRRAVEIAQKAILSDNNNSHNNKRAKTTHNRKGRKNKNNKNNNMMEVVTLQHLKSAKAAFEQSNDIQIVSSLSIYEKLFLTAIVMYNTRNCSFAGTTIKYRQKFDSFIETRLGDTKMNNVHFRNMVNRLKDMGIIKVSFDKKEWKEFITFNIKIDEAAHALQENDICAKVLSTLQAV